MTTRTETWTQITRYPAYEACDDGRIRIGNPTNPNYGKIIKPFLSGDDELFVRLRLEWKAEFTSSLERLALLILETYKPDFRVVSWLYMDGDATNCSIRNLDIQYAEPVGVGAEVTK